MLPELNIKFDQIAWSLFQDCLKHFEPDRRRLLVSISTTFVSAHFLTISKRHTTSYQRHYQSVFRDATTLHLDDIESRNAEKSDKNFEYLDRSLKMTW